METVARGRVKDYEGGEEGKKSWVDILCDIFFELGLLDLEVLLLCRGVSREWRGALNHALALLCQVSFPVGVTLEGHYQILKLLGEGAYGTVMRCRWRGTPVAIKRVNLHSGNAS